MNICLQSPLQFYLIRKVGMYMKQRSKSCASASFSHPENMLIWKIKRSAVSYVNDSITHADSIWYSEETNVTNQGSTL